MDMVNAPELLRKFITHVDTIKGKSQKTADAYFIDLQTFFRYIKVVRGLVATPTGFNSPDSGEAISALRGIDISDVSLDLVKSVTLDDLYTFLAYANRTRSNSARARARKVSSLHMFFKFLHGILKVIDSDPAEMLESPKIGKSLPVHLDLESSRALLSAAKEHNVRDHLILTLFLNCGVRRAELVGINVTDIQGKTLVVTGKGNKQRTVYLNKACLEAMENYLPERGSTATKNKAEKALFLNNHGERLGVVGVHNIVKKYLQLAGLDTSKYSAHKLRHTAATLMYQHGGVDVRALQEILGHEQLSTTQIYTHIDEKHLQDAVDRNPLASE